MLHANININKDYCTASTLSTSFNDYTNRRIKSFPPNLISHINQFLKQNDVKNNVEDYFNYYEFLDANPTIKDNFPFVFSYNSIIKPTDYFFHDIKKDLPSSTLLEPNSQPYPIAVRYTDSKKVWLIERPPFKATITYKSTVARQDAKQSTADIWMPWTVMLVISEPENSNYITYLFFNDSSITSLDDLAVPCFHMNMYEDGKMCLNATYVMLQQYLSEINSYNISDIYNFVLNDYMSGGWNADLGLNVFNRYSSLSPTVNYIKQVISSGSPELNIKSSLTSTGRISQKRYINNYFKYFSYCDLDQTLALITSIKQDISNHPSVSNYYSSYRSLIEKYKIKIDSPLTYLFESVAEEYPLIQNRYRLFVDASISKFIIENQEENKNFISKILESLRLKLLEMNKDEITSMLEDPSYTVNFTLNNKSLYLDKNLSVHLMDDNFDYNNIINIESYANA